MSNDEFESWLSLVGRLLGLSEGQRRQISEELRDHLESRVADLLESGMDRQAAVLKAVEEFGDAAVLAKNLQSVSIVNRKRWMMRFMTLATIALFFVAVLTMAMWPEKARFGSPSQSVAQEESEAANEPSEPFAGGANTNQVASVKVKHGKPSPRSVSRSIIHKKLAENYDLTYDQEPFGDVHEELQQDLGVNIVIDGNLEGVLDPDSLVTANLTGIPLSAGLRMMLKNHDVTYVIQQGVLVLISVDDEQEPSYLSRHMIDVQETLRIIKGIEGDRIGKPRFPVIGATGGGGRGGGGGVFRIAPQAEEPKEKATQKTTSQIHVPVLTAEELLVETISRVVAPDSWRHSGGDCDMTCIGGVLVVLSNESLAEEVQDFVVDLEYQLKNRD